MNDFKKPNNMSGGCPGSQMRQFEAPEAGSNTTDENTAKTPSELRQWPVQLMLVPPHAPYFKEAELVLTADCVPFAYADYHRDYLKNRPIAIACPKLDNLEYYTEKLTEIIKVSQLTGIEVMVMEVPCCNGLYMAAMKARDAAGVDFPIKVTTIGVRGENFGTKIV